MVEKEYLIEPKLETSTSGLVDWIEDVGNANPGFTFHDGSILVKSKVRNDPFGDNAKSISVTVCSTYPECPFCTEREECPVSNFKKQPQV